MIVPSRIFTRIWVVRNMNIVSLDINWPVWNQRCSHTLKPASWQKTTGQSVTDTPTNLRHVMVACPMKNPIIDTYPLTVDTCWKPDQWKTRDWHTPTNILLHVLATRPMKNPVTDIHPLTVVTCWKSIQWKTSNWHARTNICHVW